jgi:histone H3/H4
MQASRQSAKRLLKEVGAKRVSDEAADALAEEMNKFSYAIAKKAVKLASHAKRSTVKREDIELAS